MPGKMILGRKKTILHCTAERFIWSYLLRSSYRLKTRFSQPPVVGNGKSQCLSSRGLPEEFKTHPDVYPSAIIEGVMAV